MACLNIRSINQTDYKVVPLPQRIEPQKGTPFLLNADVTVLYTGHDTDMLRVANMLCRYVSEQTGLELKLTNGKTKEVKRRSVIVLTIDPNISHPEGYRISITQKNITISAPTPQGIFYGVQTLRKSLPTETAAGGITLPPVLITDEPRFGYRGMHLDCARHFYTIEEVKTYLDMMVLHNMNRFHWHLTDDQGWRIEIKKHPLLTEKGSIRKKTVIGVNSDIDDETPYGGFYTQEQVREITQYAADRFITVIPEIEMPGHMVAALSVYPELGCTGGPYEVGWKWGISWDVLCVANPRTLDFVKDVLTEVADLFTSEYIHVGGDETPTDRWSHCAKCQALGTQNVQGYFTRQIEQFLTEKNRKMIGWDEISEMGADRRTIIMSWRGSEPGFKAAAEGHDVIMAPTSHCYWDYLQAEDPTFEPSQVGLPITVEKVYSLDPAPDSIPTPVRQHIIGVQANLWTERIVNFRHAQYQVLPRMAALAEVQWTQPEQKDFTLFLPRLTHLTALYDLYCWQYAIHLWPERQPNRWHF